MKPYRSPQAPPLKGRLTHPTGEPTQAAIAALQRRIDEPIVFGAYLLANHLIAGCLPGRETARVVGPGTAEGERGFDIRLRGGARIDADTGAEQPIHEALADLLNIPPVVALLALLVLARVELPECIDLLGMR